MPRRSRLVLPGLPHHITQRGNNKQKIFFDENDYFKYLAKFEEARKKNGLSVISFCLMPNHLHFVAIPNNPLALATTFNYTHRQYVHYFNGKYSHCGHVFQNRFYSCPISIPHVLKVIRYVEMNPLRGSLVKNIDNWPWSSAPYRIKGNKSIITLDNLPEIIPNSPKFWIKFSQEDIKNESLDIIRKHTRSGKLFDQELTDKFWGP